MSRPSGEAPPSGPSLSVEGILSLVLNKTEAYWSNLASHSLYDLRELLKGSCTLGDLITVCGRQSNSSIPCPEENCGVKLPYGPAQIRLHYKNLHSKGGKCPSAPINLFSTKYIKDLERRLDDPKEIHSKALKTLYFSLKLGNQLLKTYAGPSLRDTVEKSIKRSNDSTNDHDQQTSPKKSRTETATTEPSNINCSKPTPARIHGTGRNSPTPTGRAATIQNFYNNSPSNLGQNTTQSRSTPVSSNMMQQRKIAPNASSSTNGGVVSTTIDNLKSSSSLQVTSNSDKCTKPSTLAAHPDLSQRKRKHQESQIQTQDSRQSPSTANESMSKQAQIGVEHPLVQNERSVASPPKGGVYKPLNNTLKSSVNNTGTDADTNRTSPKPVVNQQTSQTHPAELPKNRSSSHVDKKKDIVLNPETESAIKLMSKSLSDKIALQLVTATSNQSIENSRKLEEFDKRIDTKSKDIIENLDLKFNIASNDFLKETVKLTTEFKRSYNFIQTLSNELTNSVNKGLDELISQKRNALQEISTHARILNDTDAAFFKKTASEIVQDRLDLKRLHDAYVNDSSITIGKLEESFKKQQHDIDEWKTETREVIQVALTNVKKQLDMSSESLASTVGGLSKSLEEMNQRCTLLEDRLANIETNNNGKSSDLDQGVTYALDTYIGQTSKRRGTLLEEMKRILHR